MNDMKNTNIILDPSNKFMAGLNRMQRNEAKAQLKGADECIVITNADLDALDIREHKELTRKAERLNWYLELAIAASLGAAVALGFVVVHGMLTTEWTW